MDFVMLLAYTLVEGWITGTSPVMTKPLILTLERFPN